MNVFSLTGAALAALGGVFYFIVAMMQFSGIDPDQFDTVSGLSGLAFASLFLGVGAFFAGAALRD